MSSMKKSTDSDRPALVYELLFLSCCFQDTLFVLYLSGCSYYVTQGISGPVCLVFCLLLGSWQTCLYYQGSFRLLLLMRASSPSAIAVILSLTFVHKAPSRGHVLFIVCCSCRFLPCFVVAVFYWASHILYLRELIVLFTWSNLLMRLLTCVYLFNFLIPGFFKFFSFWLPHASGMHMVHTCEHRHLYIHIK